MCKKNRDGAYPSCLEAKFEGPGCEDWDLCAECADTLKGRLDAANLQIGEYRAILRRIATEDHEARSCHFPALARLVLSDPTEKPKDPMEEWKNPGPAPFIEKRIDEPRTAIEMHDQRCRCTCSYCTEGGMVNG